MDLGLTGKTALITGASRGIGYAIAEGFLSEGASVILLAQNRNRLAAAVSRLREMHDVDGLPTRVEGVCADASDDAALTAVVGRVGTPDILVNNAGAIPGGGLERVDDAAWRRGWDLKLYGTIGMTRLILPVMMERGHGVIINVVGIFGVAPAYDYICGATGNAALNAFTKAVGAEASRRGVRVLGVNPGPTRTERLEALYRARAAERFGDENRWPELLGNMPFGRAAEPSEIADLVVYLGSARASYLSGVMIDADGGGIHMPRG